MEKEGRKRFSVWAIVLAVAYVLFISLLSLGDYRGIINSRDLLNYICWI